MWEKLFRQLNTIKWYKYTFTDLGFFFGGGGFSDKDFHGHLWFMYFQDCSKSFQKISSIKMKKNATVFKRLFT